jgi:hypothetical protein
VSDYYHETENALRSQNYTEFIKHADQGRNAYAEVFFSYINQPENFESEFNPNVKKVDVTFSEEALSKTRELLKKEHYEENLFGNNRTARIVEILHRTETLSKTIPSHIESSVLDALRLHEDRDLLNIIGGSMHVSSDSAREMNTICKIIINIAHEKLLNVMVPGTHGGIGSYFAQEYIRYNNEHTTLSHHKKMHMFSVTPGGSIYYPGNPFFQPENKEDNFAPLPIDNIITPYPADWNIADMDIRKSRYMMHIAYMESLCSRLSAGNKQVVIVINGGLFTIAELEQLLKQPITLIFVKETGRSATALSTLVDKVDILSIESIEKFSKQVQNICESEMSQEQYDEFTKKDFGTSTDTTKQKHVFYRELLLSIVRRMKDKSHLILSCTSDELESVLKRVL